MILLSLFIAFLLFCFYSLQKDLFSKWPSPIALVLLGKKAILSNRSFKKAQASPSFSTKKTIPLLGRWFFLETYETAKSDPQGEFIASVCHELKTPLTIIKGFSEMISSLENPSITVLESAMKKIYHASLRMEKTIQNLTTLQELEHLSSKQKIPCNLIHMLEGIKSQLTQVYPGAEIEIASDLGSDFTIEANPGLLEVALHNLMGNALKYSKENDPFVKISISAREANDGDEENLIIQVADRGIGIAKEELSKIFDRFYRSQDPKAQKKKGSGLGLAIAKKIIEGHGGMIDAHSEEGKGTSFTLSLPLSCPLAALPS